MPSLWDRFIGKKGYFESANSRMRDKDYEGAIKEYTKALTLEGDEYIPLHHCYLSRAICKASIGDHSGAVPDYEKAVRQTGAWWREASESLVSQLPAYVLIAQALTGHMASNLYLRRWDDVRETFGLMSDIATLAREDFEQRSTDVRALVSAEFKETMIYADLSKDLLKMIPRGE